MDTNSRALDTAYVGELTGSFSDERGNQVARNAVTSMNVLKAARNPTTMRSYADTYGVSLRTGKVTDQRHSGRCWMFASYNVARARTMKLLDVEDFEFSQAFGMFYDKLEKANAFLCDICDTAASPVDDREVCELLEDAAGDGGEFVYAANLIEKWGLVPKDAMPETACTKDSAEMNAQLRRILHKDAACLRDAVAAGAGTSELAGMRTGMLAEVHRMLCVCLGEPPLAFDLECVVGKRATLDESKLSAQLPLPEHVSDGGAGKDDDDVTPKRVLRDPGITPLEFAERYVGFDADDYVELVSIPGETRPFGHVYGVRLLDSVLGARRCLFLNVAPEELDRAAIRSLEAGVPCYMACDVSKDFGRQLDDFPGILACDSMDTEALFDVDLSMARASMYDMRESCLTHAMTFQGVELDEDGGPVAWRVENSWGKDSCKDGYLIMSADWFHAFGGDVVVERRFVPSELLQLWDSGEVVEVEPWAGIGAAIGLKD